MTRILLLFSILSVLSLQAQQSAPATPTRSASDSRTSDPPGTSNVVPDPRLYDAFDSTYLESLRRDNPVLLQRWNFYLDNAYVITEFPAQKGDVSQFPAVQISDISSIHILVLEKNQHLTHDWHKPVFYRINNTRKVLMYYPGKEFNRKFREWLSKDR